MPGNHVISDPGCLSRRAALGTLVATLPFAYSTGHAAAERPLSPGEELTRKALTEYIELDKRDKLKDKQALDSYRLQYGIRREMNGRVQLRSRTGSWYSIRLDLEVPGAVLLQDESGYVYALECDGLAQIDLSDDYVLFTLFADPAWEEEIVPIEYEDDDGKAVQLKLSRQEFRDFVGLLKDFEAEPANEVEK